MEANSAQWKTDLICIEWAKVCWYSPLFNQTWFPENELLCSMCMSLLGLLLANGKINKNKKIKSIREGLDTFFNDFQHFCKILVANSSSCMMSTYYPLNTYYALLYYVSAAICDDWAKLPSTHYHYLKRELWVYNNTNTYCTWINDGEMTWIFQHILQRVSYSQSISTVCVCFLAYDVIS